MFVCGFLCIEIVLRQFIIRIILKEQNGIGAGVRLDEERIGYESGKDNLSGTNQKTNFAGAAISGNLHAGSAVENRTREKGSGKVSGGCFNAAAGKVYGYTGSNHVEGRVPAV